MSDLRHHTLAAVIEQPELFDTLSREAQDELYAQVAALEATLRAKLLARARIGPVHPPEPNRAVGLDEACTILGVTRSWLERRQNWVTVGGYKDLDGHPKFSLAGLQDYVRLRSSPSSSSASRQLRA